MWPDPTIRSLRPHRMTYDGGDRWRGAQITSLVGSTATIRMQSEANIVRTVQCPTSLIPADALTVGCPIVCRVNLYADAVRADSPTGWWRLGETSGTTAADSIGSNTGTIAGGVTLNQVSTIGDNDAAMAFNGTTGKITLGTTANAAAMTVEAWIKTTFASQQVVVSNRSGTTSGGFFYFGENALRRLFIFCDNSTPTALTNSTGQILNDGNWHHVVATMDGATTNLYVDGALDLTGAQTHASGSGTGGIGFETGQFYSGSIDEVAIYGTALSSTRVFAHYAAGVAAPYAVAEVQGSSFADPPGPSGNAASVARGEFRPGIVPRSLTGEPETWWEG